MSTTEEEFKAWLRRPNKTPQESLRFSLRAWQSVEFALSSKYELILQWLVELTPAQLFPQTTGDQDDFQSLMDALEQLLSLRAPPGLIDQQVKQELIQWFLQMSSSNTWFNLSDPLRALRWAQLLHALIKFEPIQDYLRLDYDLYATAFGKTFDCCDLYLRTANDHCNKEQQHHPASHLFLAPELIEFMADVLKTLKEIVQRIGDVTKFAICYTKNMLESLVKVTLQLRSSGYNFWNELLELEQLLTNELDDKKMVNRLMDAIDMDYVRLYCLECAVINRKGLDAFIEKLLIDIFDKFSNHLMESSNASDDSNRLWLTILSSLFEILKRHDINLNFMIADTTRVIHYLGEKIYMALKQYRNRYLPEILRLLCSTLRLNPLILEEYFYEMAVWMILTPKSNPDAQIDQTTTHRLFSEFLILLIMTFKRLSRVEKFVVNLLRELNRQLNNDVLTENDTSHITSESDVEDICPRKMRRLSQQETDDDKLNTNDNRYLKLLLKDLFGKDSITSEVDKMEGKGHLTSIANAFGKLNDYWPSSSVGLAFSQLVTGLMLKPSLVVWKSLLFAMKDLLQQFEEKTTPFNGNEMLLIDLHVALLCQYFSGFKLTEQCTIDERSLQDILTQYHFTRDILQKFGKMLLRREHEPRLMCAFLQLTYFASCFQLMLIYYKGDDDEACKNEGKFKDLFLTSSTIDRKEESTTNQDGKDILEFDGNSLHNFISIDEWNLMKQRVVNFGRTNCKYLLQRLYLQRIQATQLLMDDRHTHSSEYTNDGNVIPIERLDYDVELLEISLKRDAHFNWLMKHFQRNEKLLLAMHIIDAGLNIPSLKIYKQDFELMELMAYHVYDKLTDFMLKYMIEGYSSWLFRLECDYTGICEDGDVIYTKIHASQLLKQLIELIHHNYYDYKDNGEDIQFDETSKPKKSKECMEFHRKSSQYDVLGKYLNILKELPLSLLRGSSKTLIFILHLAVYRDIRIMNDQFNDLEVIVQDITKDMFHFGPRIPLQKCFTLKQLLIILPPKLTGWELYEDIIDFIVQEEKGCERFLMELLDYVQPLKKNPEMADSVLNTIPRHLLLLILKKFPAILSGRKFRKQYKQFLNIFAKYIQGHFSDILMNGMESATSKKHQDFVGKTLPGFILYAESVLEKQPRRHPVKASDNDKIPDAGDEKIESNATNLSSIKIDENFKRLFKVYLANSIDYRNMDATKLMEIALKYRLSLDFDGAEIEFVLSNYWEQINEDLNSGKLLINDELSSTQSSVKMAIKLILEHKSNEDFLILLKTLANETHESPQNTIKSMDNLYDLLALIAKCPLSRIKGAIFNEEYKRLTMNLSIPTLKDALESKNFDLPMKILQSQCNLLENKTIPISLDAVDTIFGCLMEIRIQGLSASSDKIPKNFRHLCRQMIEMCQALIKHRPIYLMDRMPQYTHIIKNLIQSIVWYKCERQKDILLPDEELSAIAELALKLETLMKSIAEQEQSIAVKRIAPFLLLFIIHLIVSNKRPITLYNKIRLHVEGICHALIAICDHRVGRFILRSSNEAGRQLYETLLKDYQKYHKFKGKM